MRFLRQRGENVRRQTVLLVFALVAILLLPTACGAVADNTQKETESTSADDLQTATSDSRPGAGGLFHKGESLVAADQEAAAGSDYAGMDILWLDFGPDVMRFETLWPDEGEGTFVVFPMSEGKPTNAMLIDKNGTVVVDRFYHLIRDFSEGLATARGPDADAYIDRKGNIVLADNDDYRLSARPFSEGLAPYILSGSSPGFSYYSEGFIDKNGDVVIPARFDEVRGFSEGLAAVKDADSGQWGFIDHSGTYVIPPSYSEEPGEFHEGLAWVWHDEEFAFIDKSGNVAIPYQGFTGDALRELKRNDSYLFYDPEAPGFFNGIARIYNYYIRKDGSILEHLTGRPFREKATLAVDDTEGEDGAWVLIDTLGKRVLPTPLPYSPFAWDTKQDGLFCIRDETKKGRNIGMMNEHGHIVIPTMFDFVSQATEGCVLVIPDAEESRIGIYRLQENAAEIIDINTKYLDEEPLSEGQDEALDLLHEALSNPNGNNNAFLIMGEIVVDGARCWKFAQGINSPDRFIIDNVYAVSDEGVIYTVDRLTGEYVLWDESKSVQ
jgi:hypothetical protein